MAHEPTMYDEWGGGLPTRQLFPQPVPNPGTPDAVDRGCLCSVRDGEPIQSEVWPAWLVRGCPLHDPSVQDG